MLLGLLTGVVSCWLMIAGGGWGMLLAGRILAGVCASTWVAFTVLYASHSPRRTPPRRWPTPVS